MMSPRCLRLAALAWTALTAPAARAEVTWAGAHSAGALQASDNRLVVGGGFTGNDGHPTGGSAFWDGQAWISPADPLGGWVEALIEVDGLLVAGAGAHPAPRVARRDPTTGDWTGLAAGLEFRPCTSNPEFAALSPKVAGVIAEIEARANGGADPVIRCECPTAEAGAVPMVAQLLPGGTVTLSFALASPGPVRVEAWDVTGRLVDRLHEGVLAAGLHQLDWNPAASPNGRPRSGLFFLRISGSGGNAATRIMLVQ